MTKILIDFPTGEPVIGWEQFARNWWVTANNYAGDVDYWRSRCDIAEGKLDRIKALVEPNRIPDKDADDV